MRTILSLTCSLMFGCSSVSYHGVSPKIEGVRGTVKIPTDDYEEFIPKLALTLSRNGFKPVTSGESDYAVKLYVGGGFGISSEITMYKAEVPVIIAKASNPGMGTWLVRGPVKRGLFTSSLRKFESQLSKLPEVSGTKSRQVRPVR